YLEQGLMVKDKMLLRDRYVNSFQFGWTFSPCCPPTSSTLVLGLDYPEIRINKLLRIGRMMEFFTRTETKTNYPKHLPHCKLDHVRKVSKDLELRVIKWFDYLWNNGKAQDEREVLRYLPDKLKAGDRYSSAHGDAQESSHFCRLAEEKVNKLYSAMELTQMKLKKILGKHKNTDKALRHRIADLERLTGEEVGEEDEEEEELKKQEVKVEEEKKEGDGAGDGGEEEKKEGEEKKDAEGAEEKGEEVQEAEPKAEEQKVGETTDKEKK
ncbi:unnamed protein product, partial [Lampetra planeri]